MTAFTPRTSAPVEYIASFFMEPTPLLDMGRTPAGKRGVGFVKDGWFEGPKMKGKVVGGADHLLVLADGSAIPDVRLALQTDTGETIQMYYKGVLKAPRAVMQKFGNPEALNPDEFYFRVACEFSTSSETLGWLNQCIAIAYAIPIKLPNGNNGVRYDVYKVL